MQLDRGPLERARWPKFLGFSPFPHLGHAWQVLFDQCGYTFNTKSLERPEVKKAVRLAQESHDKSVLQLMKSYADVGDKAGMM